MDSNKLLEISDEIIAFDPKSLNRIPVRKKNVISKFLDCGNKQAVKIVSAMPEKKGFLDEDYVNQLFLVIHCELQYISEEFQHGQRVAELLQPLIQVLINSGTSSPLRIVDIGCGTGYVLRWLAAHMDLTNVELVGADYNSVLIEEARRLAQIENLNVRFSVANAFEMDEVATIYISTGVIHHFRGDHLKLFFQSHNKEQTQAFCHFDFQPSIFSIPGAWVIHLARMKEAVCFHDGIVSAKRAYDGQTLHAAAKDISFSTAIYSSKLWFLPIPRAMHTFLGLRPHLRADLKKQLGRRSNRLGEWK
ncbi:class I SAM-dependent methyltransferase [Candidatus Uabimicrobium sp. HlEnr_7]|uniref:class I SAM-dependent methyltransferase n=1 Tax=Candidatus Uabimicrobium helgolandensis TaxID=3095367 RepID=UPI003557FB15